MDANARTMLCLWISLISRVKINCFLTSVKRQALQLYLEGLGFRSIGRFLGVSHVSVQKWIKKFGQELEDVKSENKILLLNSMRCTLTLVTKKILLDLDCC